MYIHIYSFINLYYKLYNIIYKRTVGDISNITRPSWHRPPGLVTASSHSREADTTDLQPGPRWFAGGWWLWRLKHVETTAFSDGLWAFPSSERLITDLVGKCWSPFRLGYDAPEQLHLQLHDPFQFSVSLIPFIFPCVWVHVRMFDILLYSTNH